MYVQKNKMLQRQLTKQHEHFFFHENGDKNVAQGEVANKTIKMMGNNNTGELVTDSQY